MSENFAVQYSPGKLYRFINNKCYLVVDNRLPTIKLLEGTIDDHKVVEMEKQIQRLLRDYSE